jgi:F-type H+-transporting ATPase subunit delta
MAVTTHNLAEAIYLAYKDKSQADQPAVSAKVVKFLARKRLFSKAPDIFSNLNKIMNNAEGRMVAKVSSAQKLTEQTKKELTHTLAKRYSAQEVSLIEKVDEKLIGGYKIEVGDEVINLTAKNKIEKLQAYLTSNHE